MNKKIALKKKEARNLSHQYNDEFAQFTLSSLDFCIVHLCIYFPIQIINKVKYYILLC